MIGNDFHFAFVSDQQVGLKTAAMNLERSIAQEENIRADFFPVQYQGSIGLYEHLPLPSTVKGTLRGIQEIRCAVPTPAQYDGILWSTWAAKSVPDLVAATHAFVRMDMTPTQMEAMGRDYAYATWRAQFLRGWKQQATRRLYQKALHLFPWSNYVKESLITDYGVPEDKITVISPGVDTEKFCPTKQVKRDGQDVVRLLFVGGDFLRKGGDLLLDWLAKYTVQRPECKVELHVVTRDPIPGAASFPQITVHRDIANNSPKLIEIYQSCDLFVLPTRADCYSLVAMEAMACGLPVIISAIGGIPDIVAEGKTGFLIAREDIQALADRLDVLIQYTARRQEMGRAARERAVTQFSSQTCTALLLDTMKTKCHAASEQKFVYEAPARKMQKREAGILQ